MGALQDHKDRFVYNEAFAGRFIAVMPDDGDWYVVILFYAALHLVDAYLVTKKWNPKLENHAERWKEIRRCPELKKPFTTAYRLLQDMSEQVRYDPGYRTQPEDHATAKTQLEKVKSFLLSKIQRAATR